MLRPHTAVSEQIELAVRGTRGAHRAANEDALAAFTNFKALALLDSYSPAHAHADDGADLGGWPDVARAIDDCETNGRLSRDTPGQVFSSNCL